MGERWAHRLRRIKRPERVAAVCVQRSRIVGKAHTGHRNRRQRRGCREFESRHLDQISRNGFMLFLLISLKVRLEQSNATRMSVAADGSTEPNLYLRLWAQMQTSLATWTKKNDKFLSKLVVFQ